MRSCRSTCVALNARSRSSCRARVAALRAAALSVTVPTWSISHSAMRVSCASSSMRPSDGSLSCRRSALRPTSRLPSLSEGVLSVTCTSRTSSADWSRALTTCGRSSAGRTSGASVRTARALGNPSGSPSCGATEARSRKSCTSACTDLIFLRRHTANTNGSRASSLRGISRFKVSSSGLNMCMSVESRSWRARSCSVTSAPAHDRRPVAKNLNSFWDSFKNSEPSSAPTPSSANCSANSSRKCASHAFAMRWLAERPIR
mmetsp:Transcript_10458/g.33244  ORF Transcript_10458/g.33244 Transcript_10458/m.33244 type:complete len:260 (+) Transcript_10458:248-1027(+)